MKIENIVIERPVTYNGEVKPIQGRVQMVGQHGKMEVNLSPQVIAELLNLIKANVQKVADYNASQASEAVDTAQGEQKLIEASDEVGF